MKNSEYLEYLLVTGKISREEFRTFERADFLLDDTPINVRYYYDKYKDKFKCEMIYFWDMVSTLISFNKNEEYYNKFDKLIEFMSIVLKNNKDHNYLMYALCDKKLKDRLVLKYDDRLGNKLNVNGEDLKISKVVAQKTGGWLEVINLIDNNKHAVYRDIIGIEMNIDTEKIDIIYASEISRTNRDRARNEDNKVKLIFQDTLSKRLIFQDTLSKRLKT